LVLETLAMRLHLWLTIALSGLAPTAVGAQQRSVEDLAGCYSWSVRGDPPSLADLEHRIALTGEALTQESDLPQYAVRPAPGEKQSSFDDVRWMIIGDVARVSWQDGVFVAELTFDVTRRVSMPGQITVFADRLSTRVAPSFNATVVRCMS
jgi:hypothetical protein